jgi:hypothetical protein
MPYTVTLFPIDLAGFIGLGPALSGTFANLTPSPPGGPGESHPRAPTERNVTVSSHSARLI